MSTRDRGVLNRPSGAPVYKKAPDTNRVVEKTASLPTATVQAPNTGASRASDSPRPVTDKGSSRGYSYDSGQPGHRRDKKSKKPYIIAAIILAVLALSVSILVYFNSVNVGIDKGRYQAVFLTNGQTYFGKLRTSGGGFMTLTDVYYLQTSSDDDSDDQSSSSYNLVKLGTVEPHAPDDTMVISNDQILFYENISEDSQVYQTIEQYKEAN